MKLTIIGLPKSGKTTIFNALTMGNAEVAAYSSSLTTNIGVAKVPDVRVTDLESIYHPKKTTFAEVNYTDVAGSPKTLGTGKEAGGELLNYLTTADALTQVVRVFPDEDIPHPEGSVDPERDMATLDLELVLSDMAIIERKLKKLELTLKRAKTSEREEYLKEQSLLQNIQRKLEQETPIREQGLSQRELRSLSNYQFLTAKPMLIILNIGENQIAQAENMESQVTSTHPKFTVVAIPGKLEMELEQLNEDEAKEFRESIGLGTPALNRIITTSYYSLGLISFFTTGPDEVKAWTVNKGTTAPQAAGKIHSDIERGFIRAEVISYDDLKSCGNLAEARKRGTLRKEGREYIVHDGDIINFLFHV